MLIIVGHRFIKLRNASACNMSIEYGQYSLEIVLDNNCLGYKSIGRYAHGLLDILFFLKKCSE